MIIFAPTLTGNMAELNASQQSFLDVAMLGHNIALLGKAGTGKTYVLNRVISLLKSCKRLQVTSSTGMSSLLFDDARTLHSFAGIGICREGKEEILKRIEERKDKLTSWSSLEVLVIDEGAQISKRVFETIEFIARSIRRNSFPFGGLQVIFSGDFFQLGPVKNEYDPGHYMFESSYWKDVFPHWVLLTDIVRQNEHDFVEFLCRLAEGTCTEADAQFVNINFTRALDHRDFGLELIPKIFCTNYQIFIETLEKLEDLHGEMHTFKSIDDGSKKVLKRCIAEQVLHLKVGTPVMLLYNIDRKLVNGSRGKVVRLNEGKPVVNFEEAGRIQTIEKKSWTFFDVADTNKMVAKRTQFPLKACWGMTAHKSQGQNLKAVTVISGNEFAPGQLYVACSRVFTKSGLCLREFDLCSLIKPPKVVTDFHNSIKRENSRPLQDDFSCCRKMCIEANELEALPLDDDFDISLLESNFDQNVEVLVPNDEIDPDDLPDDEPDPDQDLPPDNQLDFDEILLFTWICHLDLSILKLIASCDGCHA